MITPSIAITPPYGGVVGIVAFAIAFQAGKFRGSTGISIGDVGKSDFILAMRHRAHDIEFVPLALILIALREFNAVSTTAIHLPGRRLEPAAQQEQEPS